MGRLDKKQRNKAKRKAKQSAIRKEKSISPFKRLIAGQGEVECWISEKFETMGQAQIFILKRTAAVSGVSCFLIDRGVVGLKDTWMRIPISRLEFEEMLQAGSSSGITMQRCTPEKARQFIAGAVRWTHDNSMRLPPGWIKAATIIGGVGDWSKADVSAFVRKFAGHPHDLRRRLIGQSFDEYVKRPDIQFVFSNLASYLDEEDDDDFDDDYDEYFDDVDDDDDFGSGVSIEEMNRAVRLFTPAATALAADTAEWVKQNLGEVPSSQLFEAWRSIMLIATVHDPSVSDMDQDENNASSAEMLINSSKRVQPGLLNEYNVAVGQILDHLKTDGELIKNAIIQHGVEKLPRGDG